MIRKVMLALLLWAAILPSTAKSQVIGSFLPENNYWIPVLPYQTNEMTEDLFHSILDQVAQVYTPIFQARGLEFVIDRDWRSGTVNAYATRSGNRAIIKMFGGLARHHTVTPDAFALVACHEIGHHLGGAPMGGWASNEGQSDYFGTAKCMRWMFGQTNNAAVLNYIWSNRRYLIPSTSIEACRAAHGEPRGAELCIRSAAAGLSLGALFADLRGEKTPPSLDTPDPTVVSRTSNAHPGSQCRVDTYFHGALCPISHTVDMDPRDYRIGACTRVAGYPFGNRPLCWFAPN